MKSYDPLLPIRPDSPFVELLALRTDTLTVAERQDAILVAHAFACYLTPGEIALAIAFAEERILERDGYFAAL